MAEVTVSVALHSLELMTRGKGPDRPHEMQCSCSWTSGVLTYDEAREAGRAHLLGDEKAFHMFTTYRVHRPRGGYG